MVSPAVTPTHVHVIISSKTTTQPQQLTMGIPQRRMLVPSFPSTVGEIAEWVYGDRSFQSISHIVQATTDRMERLTSLLFENIELNVGATQRRAESTQELKNQGKSAERRDEMEATASEEEFLPMSYFAPVPTNTTSCFPEVEHASKQVPLPHAANTTYDETVDQHFEFSCSKQEVWFYLDQEKVSGTLTLPVRRSEIPNSEAISQPERKEAVPNLVNVETPDKMPVDIHAGLPAFVLCHGFTGTRTQSDIWPRLATALAHRGMAAFSISYRYSTKDEYQNTTYASQRDDIVAAVDYLFHHAQELGIDPQNIGLIGMSQGGLVASMAAAKHPLVKRVCLWNPVVNPPITYQGFFGGLEKMTKALQNGEGLVTQDGWPCGHRFVKDLFMVSTAAELARFTGRVLIIVSTGDPIIPQPSSVEALAYYHPGHTTVVQIQGSDHMLGVFSNDEQQKFREVDAAIAWTLKWLTQA